MPGNIDTPKGNRDKDLSIDRAKLAERILLRGREFFVFAGDEKPSVFDKHFWTGKIMDWSMHHGDFKVQLFRFIDVLPNLTTDKALARHIREYFGQDENVPVLFKLGAKSTGIGGLLGMKLLGATIRKNLESMALQFIIGGTAKETVKNLAKLRDKGFAFTINVLGEATVSEKEAEQYTVRYIELLEALGQAQSKWDTLGAGSSELDWGRAPKVDISVKPSALYSQADPADFEGTVGAMLERLKPIYRKVVQLGGSMCIDIEMRKFRYVIFELYKRLRTDPEFRDYPHLGLAMQCYLKDGDGDLDMMLDWARAKSLPISLRIVKGAYWDYEIVVARQSGWPVPVYTVKAQTDFAFERFTEKILRNRACCTMILEPNLWIR